MTCLKTGACKILVSGGGCWIKDAVFLLVLQQKILKNFLILIGIILEEALKQNFFVKMHQWDSMHMWRFWPWMEIFLIHSF